MTTGLLKRTNEYAYVRLIENLAAANTVADGVAGDVLLPIPTPTKFFDLRVLDLPDQPFRFPDYSTILLYETAGSGTMTLSYARVVCYSKTAGKLFYPGPGLDADKGKLNLAGALGETGSDTLRHMELFAYPGHCDGIQVQLGTFGGTNPTYNVDWIVPIIPAAPAFDFETMKDIFKDALEGFTTYSRRTNP